MATTAQRLAALEAALVTQKAWNVAVNGRIAALEASMANVILRITKIEGTVTPPVPPPVEPPPTAGVAHFPGSGPATPAALSAMAADMSIDVIEIASGTYSPWRRCYLSIDRTSRPLTIRKAAGATVTFGAAGDGDYGDSAFRFYSPAAYITLDGFSFQHYLIAQDGVFLLIDAHHITLKNIRVRNAAAKAISNDESSHTIYVSHGVHDCEFSDFDVANVQASDEAGASYQLQGLHLYTGGSGAAIYNVTARRWTVDGAGWAAVVRSASTGLLYDGWVVSHCGHGSVPAAMDFGTNNTGTVRNCVTTASFGTPHIMGVMTDGGGNSWA